MASDRPATPCEERIEHLAVALVTVAGDQNVRVLEAVAAALANRYRRQDETGHAAGPEEADLLGPGLAEAPAAWDGQRCERLELCRRIARRAVRGSLTDPTGGATTFHRVDESPAWARHLLPLAVFGRFLFYGSSTLPRAR